MEGLSKLTDSFLPLIVLIVIAGTRILMTVRRQARKRDQERNPEEEPASPVTIEEAEQADPDDEFSAWSLSVNDEEPEELPADTKSASLFTALSSTSSVPVSGEIPAWLQSPSRPEAPPPAEASVSVAAVMENRAPETAGDGRSPGLPPSYRHGVESRIRSLPPLQQGVVWAEILGTPKGL
jgi:hypothetical protein